LMGETVAGDCTAGVDPKLLDANGGIQATE
jgi:hypothetical protein